MNSKNYFSLPVLQNLSDEDFFYLLENDEVGILKLRNSIKEYRLGIYKGCDNQLLNLIAGKIKEDVAEINSFIKRLKRDFQITTELKGLDFFDLEKQIKQFRDELFKINEGMATDFEKRIYNSPNSIFWKTKITGKIWDIDEFFLMENKTRYIPKRISHWLFGTSSQPPIINIKKQ